jgi:hypothetical protein
MTAWAAALGQGYRQANRMNRAGAGLRSTDARHARTVSESRQRVKKSKLPDFAPIHRGDRGERGEAGEVIATVSRIPSMVVVTRCHVA